MRSDSWLLQLSMFGVSLILLAACDTPSILTPAIEIVESSCSPPCWYSIVPGETTRSEALDTLNGLDFVLPESITVNSAGDVGWYQGQIKTGVSGHIAFETDIVRYIRLDNFYDQITVQQLIELFGDPEGAWVSWVFGPGNDLVAFFVWPEQGLSAESERIDYDVALQQEVVVTPDTNAYSVTFTITFDVATEYSEALESFQPWQGLDAIHLPD